MNNFKICIFHFSVKIRASLITNLMVGQSKLLVVPTDLQGTSELSGKMTHQKKLPGQANENAH